MVEVLERGDISFFFRPRVQPADAPAGPATAPGVQSFFFVLSMAGDRHRRVRVGRKRMPAAAGERLWARVERTGSLQRVLADQLEAEEYRTKTRGDRYQPGARPIGQGCYAFVRHGDHLHLVYRLTLLEPDIPDDVRVPEAGSDLVLFERSEMGGGDPAGFAGGAGGKAPREIVKPRHRGRSTRCRAACRGAGRRARRARCGSRRTARSPWRCARRCARRAGARPPRGRCRGA
jgi:hypothetical protein